MDTLFDSSSYSLPPGAVEALLGRPDTPLILDVRRTERFEASGVTLPLARHCTPEQLADLVRQQPAQKALVYCVYGHELSQAAAALLREAGWQARYLQGGIEGGEPGVDPPPPVGEAPVLRVNKRSDLGVNGQTASRWITRSAPKIDRIACPWLIARFIDREAQFHYRAPESVAREAARLDAVPFDVAGSALSHVGPCCSFDALMLAFGLRSAALDLLADVVRAADTGQAASVPAAAGLLAVSLGMARLQADDDRAMLAVMMPVYDALYAWCQDRVTGRDTTHLWTTV